ncbi:hypothetical protein [Streptomyces sp. ME19-01-6]|uniref:hypothetical protein n=1 Tax=Streptomyces sp. ME19-01-6 TaxID=3028686 RepID=UPI0029A140D5|nr:hypothetical protein [Streptomyces sp. ME19-01-6]MDX3229896.1 hypothetical protein [Streptomyces sp. ME19-01-6]
MAYQLPVARSATTTAWSEGQTPVDGTVARAVYGADVAEAVGSRRAVVCLAVEIGEIGLEIRAHGPHSLLHAPHMLVRRTRYAGTS